jgi:hypothetical protein
LGLLHGVALILEGASLAGTSPIAAYRPVHFLRSCRGRRAFHRQGRRKHLPLPFRGQGCRRPHQLNIPPCLALKTPARPHPLEELKGCRPVFFGSARSQPRQARSSSSTRHRLHEPHCPRRSSRPGIRETKCFIADRHRSDPDIAGGAGASYQIVPAQWYSAASVDEKVGKFRREYY